MRFAVVILLGVLVSLACSVWAAHVGVSFNRGFPLYLAGFVYGGVVALLGWTAPPRGLN